MKIGFFGDGPWSHNAFNLLLKEKDYEISFVCVRNDPGDEVLIGLAKRNKIEVIQHENINSSKFISKLQSFKCDIFVSLAFNQIFKKEVISIPLHGAINCHAGKLPRYRGRNILNWALINDEKEFGITVHYIDEGIDTGDIILQKTFPITDSDCYKTLLKTAYMECGPIVMEALRSISSRKEMRVKQSDISNKSFYCVGRKQGDELIDWNQSSREIFNFIRSITDPGPNARGILNNKEMQIIKSVYDENRPLYRGIIGSVVGIESDGIIVKTNDSDLKIIEYIYKGKIRIGDRFER